MIMYQYLRETYPEELTGEQVRLILHYSRRKVSWMLDNQYIKCEISEGKTRKYKVKLSDVIFYLEDSEVYPQKYIFPPDIFSSQLTLKSKGKDRINKVKRELIPMQKEKDFRIWLEERWKNVSETIRTSEIPKLLGYNSESVRRWIASGKLEVVEIPNAIITTKTWLIDFYCSYGNKITRPSKNHIRIMHEFLGESS